MDEFSRESGSIEAGAVERHLRALTSPCYESTLLRIGFPGMEIASVSPLALYRSHFLLFNLLYRLQDAFYAEGKYLHVHFMRIFLSDYPPAGECRHYDDETGRFCGEACPKADGYCPFHRKAVGEKELEALSDKYFYLDPENLDLLDERTAKSFLEGAWELLTRYETYEKSLSVLGITGTPDLAAVKRRFRGLAKIHHPDRGGESRKRFNEINRAYRFLLKVIPG